MANTNEYTPDVTSESDESREDDPIKEESLEDIRNEFEMNEEEKDRNLTEDNASVAVVFPSKRKRSEENSSNENNDSDTIEADDVSIEEQEERSSMSSEEHGNRRKISRVSIETANVASTSLMATTSTSIQPIQPRPPTPFAYNRESLRLVDTLNDMESYIEHYRQPSRTCLYADLHEFNARHYNIQPAGTCPDRDCCHYYRENLARSYTYIPPGNTTPNYPIRPTPTHRYVDWYKSNQDQSVPMHLAVTNSVMFQQEPLYNITPTFVCEPSPVPEEDLYFSDDENLPHGI